MTEDGKWGKRADQKLQMGSRLFGTDKRIYWWHWWRSSRPQKWLCFKYLDLRRGNSNCNSSLWLHQVLQIPLSCLEHNLCARRRRQLHSCLLRSLGLRRGNGKFLSLFKLPIIYLIFFSRRAWSTRTTRSTRGSASTSLPTFTTVLTTTTAQRGEYNFYFPSAQE